MKCEDCGKRDSLIHLSETRDGEVISTWLCPQCAAARQMPGFLHEDTPAAGDSGDRGDLDDARSLASFLNQGLSAEMEEPAHKEYPGCFSCGYTLRQYRQSNRLGCPHCYRAFAEVLRPTMARYHGRCLHLGRTPGDLAGGSRKLAELTRSRINLERAIRAEDFEDAARIRDFIQQLEEQRDQDGDGS